MTVWETVERGEYVMIALAVLIIVIVCIWWVRGVKLRRQRRTLRVLMPRVRDNVVESDIENAIQFCQSMSTPGAKVIGAGLQRIGRPITEISLAMHEVADIEKKSMAKGCRWLLAFAVIAPLIGLGGTLVGIIDRLRDLGELGPMADISVLCNNLAPTIVTTVAGLITGVFSLVAYTFLSGNISVSRQSLDQTSADFINLLDERV